MINYPGDTSSVQSYFYDDNGNMIQDLDKGLDAQLHIIILMNQKLLILVMEKKLNIFMMVQEKSW